MTLNTCSRNASASLSRYYHYMFSLSQKAQACLSRHDTKHMQPTCFSISVQTSSLHVLSKQKAQACLPRHYTKHMQPKCFSMSVQTLSLHVLSKPESSSMSVQTVQNLQGSKPPPSTLHTSVLFSSSTLHSLITICPDVHVIVHI